MQTHRNALPAGYTLQGYQIDAVLGAGGFGITYQARETAIDRTIAIKEYLPSGIATRVQETSEIHPTGPNDAEDFEWGLDRFRQEAKTLVSFRHPNIIAILRFFEANNTAYLVMDYERGENLGSVLSRHQTLSEEEVRGLVAPLLDGLASVHQAGFLHRDIKPDNIYIRTDGTPVLLDFGSARQAMGARSQTMTSIVSAGYAPFEQYIGDAKQGPWSDIYGLGAVLYRAVTGNRPPEATARMRDDEIEPAIVAGRGRYSPALLAAIDAALAVREADRPQTVEDFATLFDVADADAGLHAAARSAATRATHVTGAPTSVVPPPEASGFTDDDLAHAKARLAEAIGPIASVLVKRAATEARDIHELYSRLAEKIPEPNDRERFLSSLHRRKRL